MDIEGVAWVQGEHDHGLHLSNVGGLFLGLALNQNAFPFEAGKVSAAFGFVSLAALLRQAARTDLSAMTEWPRMRCFGSGPTRAESTSWPSSK